MIDQVIIACDDKLTVLYNNYHERFYNKIMMKVNDKININHIRMRNGTTLNRCFAAGFDSFLETDQSTMNQLIKMYQVFSYDETDDDQMTNFRTQGILKIIQTLHEYESRSKRLQKIKAVKQMHLEAKRSEIISLRLLVIDT